MTSSAYHHRDFTRDTGRSSNYTSRLDQIISAASKLFVEHGYEETSIQEVAEAVGMLKGSLYHYIDAKDDLLFWAMKRNHEGLYEFVSTGLESSSGLSPIKQFSGCVDQHVKYALNNQDSSLLFAHSFRILSDERRAEILALRRRYEDMFVRLVVRAQGEEQKAGSGNDGRIIARVLLSMCNGVAQWYRPDSQFTIDSIREHCVAIAVRAVESGFEVPGARRS